ncbi:hypothetical protein [Natrinema halophilum]|uniref:hypothetical protein n=1 Tax=Natrinema halophilum TaxID=1699371 RepID=UPI001F44B0DA|nr:hypothetical protein [Natrinema halophilum]UHQ96112.1 hypothetical protein HYG82_22560 [Natrinema halophilum]
MPATERLADRSQTAGLQVPTAISLIQLGTVTLHVLVDIPDIKLGPTLFTDDAHVDEHARGLNTDVIGVGKPFVSVLGDGDEATPELLDVRLRLFDAIGVLAGLVFMYGLIRQIRGN